MKILKMTISLAIALLSIPVMENTYLYSENNKNITSETLDFYDYWKNKYIVKDKYEDTPQYYVWYSSTPYSDNNTGTKVTVSEAHGYGMLITASMKGYF